MPDHHYDLDRLEKLVLKAIDTYSEMSGRVGSVEEAVKSLRDDLKEIRNDNKGFMRDISSSLTRLAEIQDANETGHKVLHKRVDAIKDELDEVQETVNAMQLNCAGVNHAELARRMDSFEHNQKQIVDSLRLFNWRLKGVPLSYVFTLILLFCFATTIYNHYPWMAEKLMNFLK